MIAKTSKVYQESFRKAKSRLIEVIKASDTPWDLTKNLYWDAGLKPYSSKFTEFLGMSPVLAIVKKC